jgi:DNA adenine methylase
MKVIKPILKWVGGKTQILPYILDQFPDEMDSYHDIFVGGGSVLLGVLSYQRQNKIKINNSVYAYDLNMPLINMYKNIQTKHEILYSTLQDLITEFKNCNQENISINRNPNTLEEATTSRESFYYWIRKQYNLISLDNSIKSSAYFIFLNKLCFRGIYRVGPNGFNVPYGHYKIIPEIINKIHLNEVSDLIKNVIFKCSDFSDSIKNINENDFTYMDPPYVPENTTSFVGYTLKGFGKELHELLFTLCNDLYNKKYYFMMSNSYTPIILEYFAEEKYHVNKITCKRAINSKNPGAKTKEVVILPKFNSIN